MVFQFLIGIRLKAFLERIVLGLPSDHLTGTDEPVHIVSPSTSIACTTPP